MTFAIPINSNPWARQSRWTQSGAGGFQYSSDRFPVDSVTLSERSHGGFVNDTRSLARLNLIGAGYQAPGQSVEEIFASPFDADTMYLKEALDKIAAARAMYGARPSSMPKKEAEKGDLRVIAGDRADGVKPREVRIDDANNYDYQKAENSYGDHRQETRFKDGTVGREYDVTVTWEDGTTTKKRVTLKYPGQLVYMSESYSY